MKRKIFSILFALVLALSLGMVTAVPAGAQDSVPSVFFVTDGTYTTTRLNDQKGDIEATLTGTWVFMVKGDFTATGEGGLYVVDPPPVTPPPWYGSTAGISVTGILSELEITFSGTAEWISGDPITNDEVTFVTGIITIEPDTGQQARAFVADLTGDIAGGYTVDIDISGSMVRPIINEDTAVSFLTIQAAIDDADTDAGDTISVGAGEYAGAVVNEDLTISGAVGGGSVITSGVIYKAGGPSYYTGFRLDDGADGAEIRNFTMNGEFWFGVFARNADSVIVDSLALNDMVQGITNWGGSGWEITNNVITETYPTTGGGIAIYLGADPTDFPHCDNNLVQYNTITTNRAQSSTFTGAAICLWFDERTYTEPTTQSVTGNQIKDNSITASGLENQTGIEIGVGGLDGDENPDKVVACLGVIHDNTVQDNTIDNAEWGLYLYVTTNLTVSGNTIKNCSDCGIYMKDDHANCLINYNDIHGNTNYGLNNTDGATYERTVDATLNWWDDVTGPEQATLNPGAQGDNVSDNVDFSPWLYKTQENFVSDAPCYAGSVVLGNEATQVEVEPVSYAGGWNSFSTPVTLDGSADYISELLALTTESDLSIVRAQRFDLASQQWVALVMGGELTGDDYQIKPGEGFFIQVSTKGSLPILCSTNPTSPPRTDLVAGWNLVGLSNLTKMTVANALNNVDYSVVLSASPPNAALWSVPPDAGKNMGLGEAYWLAMGQPGILFGHTTTPVADDITWKLNK